MITRSSLGKSGGYGKPADTDPTFTRKAPRSAPDCMGLLLCLDGRGTVPLNSNRLCVAQLPLWILGVVRRGDNDDACIFRDLMRRFAQYWKGGYRAGYITEASTRPTFARPSPDRATGIGYWHPSCRCSSWRHPFLCKMSPISNTSVRRPHRGSRGFIRVRASRWSTIRCLRILSPFRHPFRSLVRFRIHRSDRISA
jgi:hypothetical protein